MIGNAYIESSTSRTVIIYMHKISRCTKKQEKPEPGSQNLFEQKRLRNLTAREIDVNSLRFRDEERRQRTERG